MIISMKEEKLLMAFLIAIAIALALLLPHYALAKGMGDTIGAPTKETLTPEEQARIDARDALPAHAFYYAAPATTTVATTSEDKLAIKILDDQSERIALLKQQIALLQQLIKLLSK